MNALAHRITGVTRAPRRPVVVPSSIEAGARTSAVPRVARVLVAALAGTSGVMLALEHLTARIG